MTGGPIRRICLSPGSIGGGGIGVVMLNLAEEFLARGLAGDVLIAARDGVARPLPEGARAVDLGARARTALPRAVAYLRDARPDAIISARDYVNLLMLAAHRIARLGPSCRLVWTFHTHRSVHIGRARRLNRIADALVARTLRRPDALVAVSSGVARDLEAGWGLPPGRVRVIENPVWSPGRARWAEAPCDHPWLAHRSPLRGGAPDEPPVLVAVGRLAPQKDVPSLLRAFAALRQARPDARLLVLGEGPERPRIEALARELGLGAALDMPGHAANPLAAMARADLFALSSLWEGFPLVLVEALGTGARVVATDCPSGPAEILDDPKLGRLVPPGDVAALAAALRSALETPRDPARQIAAAHRFDGARAANRYLALLAPGP